MERSTTTYATSLASLPAPELPFAETVNTPRVKSLFERIIYIYVRTHSYDLCFEHRLGNGPESAFGWKSIAPRLKNAGRSTDSTGYRRFRLKDRRLTTDDGSGAEREWRLMEKSRRMGMCVGVIFNQPAFISGNSGGGGWEEDSSRFIRHMLSSSFVENLWRPALPSIQPATDDLDRIIAALFSKRLRHSPRSDLWNSSGESSFLKTISRYTCRNIPVEFVLPAFPCKSTSTEKVGGKLPDFGEELALRNLVSFCEAVEEIYPPGANIWIVSDGHVFSDCVGVDDEDVDEYNRGLREMIGNIAGGGCIQFVCLRDLLAWEDGTLHSYENPVYHPLETKISGIDDRCRQALSFACRPAIEDLRSSIKDSDSEEVWLYRGLSKFMLNDLCNNPQFIAMASTSQRKKLASDIAFEMVLRNQAYSNLIELFFPACVRLSIHAHPNRGPKFGISLLPRDLCRPLNPPNELNDDSIVNHHIATPWHNTILELTGGSDSRPYLVVKAGFVKQATPAKWVSSDEKALDGRFVLDAGALGSGSVVDAGANLDILSSEIRSVVLV